MIAIRPLGLVSLLCVLMSAQLARSAPVAAMDRVKKAGKLVVAVEPSYPPMEFEGRGQKLEGFDIELITALAKNLGLKTEFMVMNWDGILAGLNSGRYDVIISSMNITPERSQQAVFVPYFHIAQVLVSMKGNPLKGPADLSGKVVAVQADTTSSAYVEGLAKKGIKIKDVKAFKLVTEAFQALKVGHAQAVVVDEPVGRYYAKQDQKTFVLGAQAIDPAPVGIAMRKSDTDLQGALAKALEELKRDGTYKAISVKWFGTELTH